MSTQPSTVLQKANKLIELLNKINEHIELKKVLVKDERSGYTFLKNEDATENKELKELISSLEVSLDDYLITDQGQHSDVYYALCDNDKVKTKVLEKDSFGPLIVGIKFVPGDWWITYG